MFSLALLSFISGVLTILAPCVLPLLPIILGSSVADNDTKKPYLVTLGLVISITLFTVILKGSTLLIDLDPQFWKIISGAIVLLFGLIYLFPKYWDLISLKLRFGAKSDELLQTASSNKSWFGSLLVGGSLGPVFASCSPTYALIIATVLPSSFLEGLVYIIIYSCGLALVMLSVGLLGRNLIARLKMFSDPNGWFKKILGIVFLVVGISVISGFDKVVETSILNSGYFDVTVTETFLIEKFNISR